MHSTFDAGRQFASDRDRPGERRTAGDARENSFLPRQRPRCTHRVVAFDGHDPVDIAELDAHVRQVLG